MSVDISSKQREILDYIKNCILDKGYPPSVREICDNVGLRSTSSVHAHLNTLEDKGLIRRDSSKTRAIEIVDDEFNVQRRDITNIPIIGQVAAGSPILAVENITDYFALPSSFLPNGDYFVLKVNGDSMINVGIYDGDYLIVKKTSSARNGEIVVALVDDSVTVKRFYKEADHIRLQPENDSLEPIIVKDCSIVGSVASLYRTTVF